MPKSNGKDAYYFSHDCNARNDNKILAMRSVYGAEGYGLYWMIIEVLREQPDYSYPLGKYAFRTLSLELHCDENLLEDFVLDCCTEFRDSHSSLLKMDENRLYSESLNRRMKLVDEISSKRSQSAKKRWGTRADANALQMESKEDQRRPDQTIPDQSRREKNSKCTAAAAEMDNLELSSLADAYREQTGKRPGEPQELKIREYMTAMSAPVVEWAFKLAIDAGADKWSYTKRILDDWMEARVKSLPDAQAERGRRFGGRSVSPANGGQPRTGKYQFASDISSQSAKQQIVKNMNSMQRLLERRGEESEDEEC